MLRVRLWAEKTRRLIDATKNPLEKKGHSLIELLCVVALAGALASLLLPSVAGAYATGRASIERSHAIHTLRLEAAMADYQSTGERRGR